MMDNAKNSLTELYKVLEKFLKQALLSVKKDLDTHDYEDVLEYIEHDEYGVAYELLDYIVKNKNLNYPAELYQAGVLMGFVKDKQQDDNSNGENNL